MLLTPQSHTDWPALPKAKRTPTRAPRWQRRPAARPEEILRAALAVFGDAGYGRARLSDVARQAGVSKATLYLYFDSKATLFRAMSGQWDFVSGYADPGDPPVGVAVKEAAEELGLTVEVTGLLGVVDGVRGSDGTDGPITTIALTAHVVAGLLRVDPVEATDVAWFRRDRLPWPLSGCVRTLAGLAFDRRGVTPAPAFFDEPRTRGERTLRRTAWRINGSSSGTSTAR